MKTKFLTLFSFLLFFSIAKISAQLDVPYAKVTLMDNSSFLGNLLEVGDEVMEFQLTTGEIKIVRREEVKSISEEKYPVDFEKERPKYELVYQYKPGKPYYIFTMGGNMSQNDSGTGIGNDIIFSAGYQHTLRFGYGISAGVDNFSTQGLAVVYPLLAEVRGYFKEKAISPYYVLQMGYGFVGKPERFGVIEANGGFTIRPSLGCRIGGRQRGNILMEIGYIYQPHYVRQIFNTSDIRVFTRTFYRLKIAIGIQF